MPSATMAHPRLKKLRDVDPVAVQQICGLIDEEKYKDAVKQADQLLGAPRPTAAANKKKKEQAKTAPLSGAELDRVRLFKCVALLRANRTEEAAATFAEIYRKTHSSPTPPAGSLTSDANPSRKDAPLSDRSILLYEHVVCQASLATPLRALHCVADALRGCMAVALQAAGAGSSSPSTTAALVIGFVRLIWLGAYDEAGRAAMSLYLKTKATRYMEWNVICVLLESGEAEDGDEATEKELQKKLTLAEGLLDRCKREADERSEDGLDHPDACRVRRNRFRVAILRASLVYRKSGPQACADFLLSPDNRKDLLFLSTDVHNLCAHVLLSGCDSKEMAAKAIDLLKPLDSAKKLAKAISAGYKYDSKDFEVPETVSLSQGFRNARFTELLAQLVQACEAKGSGLEPAKAVFVELLGFPENVFDLRGFLTKCGASSPQVRDMIFTEILPVLQNEFCEPQVAAAAEADLAVGDGAFGKERGGTIDFYKKLLLKNVVVRGDGGSGASLTEALAAEKECTWQVLPARVFVNIARMRYPSEEDASLLLRMENRLQRAILDDPSSGSSLSAGQKQQLSSLCDDLYFLRAASAAESLLTRRTASAEETADLLSSLCGTLQGSVSDVEKATRRCATLALLLHCRMPRLGDGNPSQDQSQIGLLFQKLEFKNILFSTRIVACVFEHLMYDVGPAAPKSLGFSPDNTPAYCSAQSAGTRSFEVVEALLRRVVKWHGEHFQDVDQLTEQFLEVGDNPELLTQSVRHAGAMQKSLSLAGCKLAVMLLRLHADIRSGGCVGMDLGGGAGSGSGAANTGAAGAGGGSGSTPLSTTGADAREVVLLRLAAEDVLAAKLQRESAGKAAEVKGSFEFSPAGRVGGSSGPSVSSSSGSVQFLAHVEAPPWTRHAGGLLNELEPPFKAEQDDFNSTYEELAPLIVAKPLLSGRSEGNGCDVNPLPQVLRPELEQVLCRRMRSQQLLQLAFVGSNSSFLADAGLARADVEVELEKFLVDSDSSKFLSAEEMQLGKIILHMWREQYEQCGELLAKVQLRDENFPDAASSGSCASGNVAGASFTSSPWGNYFGGLIAARLFVLLLQTCPKTKKKTDPRGVFRTELRTKMQETMELYGSAPEGSCQSFYDRRARQIKDVGFKV